VIHDRGAGHRGERKQISVSEWLLIIGKQHEQISALLASSMGCKVLQLFSTLTATYYYLLNLTVAQ